MSQTLVQPKNTNQRESFCKLLTWWKKPNEVNDLELLRRIMNLGTWEMWQWAWQNFTEESFVHCLTDARYGDFSKGSWHYWHIRLSISPIPPVPKNKFLAENEEVRFPGT